MSCEDHEKPWSPVAVWERVTVSRGQDTPGWFTMIITLYDKDSKSEFTLRAKSVHCLCDEDPSQK